VQLKFDCHTLDTKNLSHISDYDNKPTTLILYFVSKRIPITDTQSIWLPMTVLQNPTLPVQQHISIKAIIYGVPVPLPNAPTHPPQLFIVQVWHFVIKLNGHFDVVDKVLL